MAERKITFTVEFEFYPDENEKLDKSLTNAEISQQLQNDLDTYLSNAEDIDGLWWHFISPRIRTEG